MSPSEQCRVVGTGPAVFDCSGFVLRAISDATGSPIDELAANTRHVRDIWQSAQAEDPFFNVGELAVGSLLITERRYSFDGLIFTIPGHVGIISVLGDLPSFIHANPQAGMVEERPLRALDTVLGCVAINL